jgi:dihydroflavonol-4-reductase
MATAAITGAAGHIGANLVRALCAQGRHVRALVHRDRRALEGLDVELVEGDVRDPPSLRRAFGGVEVIYHLAARISLAMDDWPLLEEINVVGTRNVVEACRRCGVRRLIHFSSIHALVQEPLDVPLDESRPLAESLRYPPYDRSKAAGEKIVRQAAERGLDAVILNPTGIIGPHDYRPSHLGGILLTIAQGKPLGLVSGGFDWVDVRDVIQGAMQAEERAAPGARYILSGHWVSLRDLAVAVAEVASARMARFVSPLWLAYVGIPFVTALAHLTGRPSLYTRASLRAVRSNRRISHERATRDLEYHPQPFRKTVYDTLQWFRENGNLTSPLALPSPKESK